MSSLRLQRDDVDDPQFAKTQASKGRSARTVNTLLPQDLCLIRFLLRLKSSSSLHHPLSSLHLHLLQSFRYFLPFLIPFLPVPYSHPFSRFLLPFNHLHPNKSKKTYPSLQDGSTTGTQKESREKDLRATRRSMA